VSGHIQQESTSDGVIIRFDLRRTLVSHHVKAAIISAGLPNTIVVMTSMESRVISHDLIVSIEVSQVS
jgi:hypothetical protein